MRLQLQHVLAGVGMRCRKVDRQPLVNDVAQGITKRQVGGLARYQRPPAYGGDDRPNILARNPNDAHRPAAGCRGNGGDGVVMSGQHKAAMSKGRKVLLCGPFYYLNFGRLNCGGTPIRVLITHCWVIARMLLVIQYSTRPAGKKKNITLKIS